MNEKNGFMSGVMAESRMLNASPKSGSKEAETGSEATSRAF
jgi:hypothetical protein